MDPKKFVEREAKRPERDPEKRKRRKSLKASRKQEERLAKKLGGRTQSGSGAARSPVRGGPYVRQRRGSVKDGRGDVDAGPLKIEAKSTAAKSVSLKRAWCAKVAREAQIAGMTPAIAWSFVDGIAEPGEVRDWVAVPAEWLAAAMAQLGLTEPDGDSA